MSRPDDKLDRLPALRREGGGPVFAEPWQAQAFALAVRLHEQGLFTWREWAEALGAEIAAAGPHDAPERYYEHWLAALEKLTERKGLISAAERLARRDAWERAARATPHGQPIVLSGWERS